MMLTLNAIMKTIESIAPLQSAMSWDNVGLIAGNPDAQITNAVLCLDLTEQVFQFCLDQKANLCISHHPFLFDPIRRIDYSDPQQRLLTKMIQHEIAIYAAHTNLDSCEGGVNDALAMITGLQTSTPFFVPKNSKDSIEAISEPSSIWRICQPKVKCNLFDYYQRVIQALRIPGCHINFDTNRAINNVLVLGGSYDSEWNRAAIASGADVVLCGEMKHHDMVFFSGYGVAVIAAGHDATERVIVPKLAKYLHDQHPQIVFAVSEAFDYNKVVF